MSCVNKRTRDIGDDRILAALLDKELLTIKKCRGKHFLLFRERCIAVSDERGWFHSCSEKFNNECFEECNITSSIDMSSLTHEELISFIGSIAECLNNEHYDGRAVISLDACPFTDCGDIIYNAGGEGGGFHIFDQNEQTFVEKTANLQCKECKNNCKH